MILFTDDGNAKITGTTDVVLSQVRAIVEAIARIPETSIIFEDMKFFNPNTSDKKVREIILKVSDEIYKNNEEE